MGTPAGGFLEKSAGFPGGEERVGQGQWAFPGRFSAASPNIARAQAPCRRVYARFSRVCVRIRDEEEEEENEQEAKGVRTGSSEGWEKGALALGIAARYE